MAIIQCENILFENIQAVIFDKDGTLTDTSDFLRNLGQTRSRLLDAKIPGIGDPLLMAFGINGDRIDPTGLMAVGSRRENQIAAAAYVAETGRSWFEALNIAAQAFAEADQWFKKVAPSPLFVGTVETIKQLSDAGLKLGILSADTTERVQALVAYYQLGDYIQLQMGVDEGLSKPDPALFWQACQLLGVEPKSTLMVGDGMEI